MYIEVGTTSAMFKMGLDLIRTKNNKMILEFMLQGRAKLTETWNFAKVTEGRFHSDLILRPTNHLMTLGQYNIRYISLLTIGRYVLYT